MGTKRTPLDLAQTLERSRQAVEASLALTADRGKQRKDHSLTPLPSDSETTVKELTEKLQNENYLRATFERAVGELRIRVEELESVRREFLDYQREVSSLHFDLQQERKWRTRFEALEAELTVKATAQRERIEALERDIRERDEQLASLNSRDLESVQAANKALQQSLQSLSEKYSAALQHRAELLSSRYSPQATATPVDADPSLAKLSEIEERLQQSSAKYEALKRKVESALTERPEALGKVKTVSRCSAASVGGTPTKGRKKAGKGSKAGKPRLTAQKPHTAVVAKGK